MMEITGTLTKEHFLQMEALEGRFYAASFITPSDVSYACYLRYPLSAVAAINNGRVAGFVNLFPVTDTVCASLMRGTFNDSALTDADMQSPNDDAALHMFLSCIVVDREYQKSGMAKALLRAAADGYRPIAHRCECIVTDNVTEAGCRFSERMGFAFICKSDHGSSVYASPYDAFLQKLRAPALRVQETPPPRHKDAP